MRKHATILVLLLAVSGLHACGEPDETCTCVCTCGGGEETTIDDAADEEDCSSQCDASCGNEGFTTNYDCTTKG